MSQNDVRLSHLAGADASRLLKSNPVILLPMGSIEDQGPHAPMGDYMLAEKIAELAAERGHARGTPTFMAPVIPYGADDFFRSAVGGAVVEQETMTALLHDLLASFIRNGLTRVIIINGHGGNSGPIATASGRIRRETGAIVPNIYLWEAAYGLMPAIVGADETKRRAGHGADPLGSVSLHLSPDLVRKSYIPTQKDTKCGAIFDLPLASLGKLNLNGVPVGVPMDYSEAYHDGVAAGDPSLIDEVTGREITERLVQAIFEMATLLSRNESSI